MLHFRTTATIWKSVSPSGLRYSSKLHNEGLRHSFESPCKTRVDKVNPSRRSENAAGLLTRRQLFQGVHDDSVGRLLALTPVDEIPTPIKTLRPFLGRVRIALVIDV